MHERRVDIDRLIGDFGLADKRDARFGSLSGGQKRRVGIVLALVNDPDIVFLDEPTTGLDPWARKDVWKEIRSLKARGKTVLLTTHYMDEAYQLADRVCILHRGRIVAEGPPEEVVRRYGGDSMLVIRECSAEARVCSSDVLECSAEVLECSSDVLECSAEVLGRLAQEIPDSRIEGSSILAKVPDSDGMASIAKAIAVMRTVGCACKEIYIRKPTLDDVFLNVTGESLTEGGV
jgi:ABC-2 type transport system ATP-binding protein